MQRQDLERMTREQLIAHAERLGIPRPRVLTQPELVDEIIGRTATSERERAKARGWLGRARDLLAKVVEKGLHLPEAARVLRQEEKNWPAPPPPLPTVTLAEIYAAQGHLERAITVLDEVLTREPDHREARSLRERFVEQLQRTRARSGRVEVAPPPPSAKEAKAAKAKDAAPKPEPTVTEPTATEGLPEVIAVSADPSAAAAEASTERPETIAAAPPAIADDATDELPEAIASAHEASDEEEAFDGAPDEPIPSTERATVEPLEEPELPARYEVDEVVAIAVDPRTIYLYWEVRPTTLARARAAAPNGEMCVRIASVTASWEGPVIDTRDLHVDALYGDRFVRDVQPGSNVRVSVGWKSAAGFEPLAVGAEVTAPRAVPVESVAEDVARWDEAKVAPFSAWSPEPEAEGRVEARGLDPFVARSAPLAPWARTAAFAPAASHGAHGAPVDTGYAIWGAPPATTSAAEEVTEREVVVQEAWFVAGGSSELTRGGPRRTRTVRVTRLMPGGASELGR